MGKRCGSCQHSIAKPLNGRRKFCEVKNKDVSAQNAACDEYLQITELSKLTKKCLQCAYDTMMKTGKPEPGEVYVCGDGCHTMDRINEIKRSQDGEKGGEK